MSKHGDALLARLHEPARALLVSPHAAIALRRLAGAVDTADDLVDAAQTTVALLVAVEDAADTLDAIGKRLRATLGAVLDDSGMPAAQTDYHTASVRMGPPSVLITDEAAIPPTLMRQPPPAPDKIAISKLLRDGQDVPGATLSNGSLQLTIKTRARNAA